MAKHILIVDDSKTVRNLVAFIMKKEGFKVSTAEDGLDGLEKLERFAPDLIILDLLMPVMDGMAFLNRIRNDARYRQTPVVICTVRELGPRENQLLGEQAQAVLLKAEDLEKELKRVLHELLRHPSTGGWSAAERSSPGG